MVSTVVQILKMKRSNKNPTRPSEDESYRTWIAPMLAASQHGRSVVEAFLAEGLINRLRYALEDPMLGETLEDVLRRHCRISEKTAQAIIAGEKPITAQLLSSLANKMRFSLDWLVLGPSKQRHMQRSISIEAPITADTTRAQLPADERDLLYNYDKSDTAGKRAIHFLLGIEYIPAALDDSARNRLLSGLAYLGWGGWLADDNLADVIRDSVRKTCVVFDLENMSHADNEPANLLFTPLHEWLGVFGPENGPTLDQLFIDAGPQRRIAGSAD